MKIIVTFLAASVLLIEQAHAECTYKEAQEKMMQVGNILQQYNKQKNEFIDSGRPIPPEIDQNLFAITLNMTESAQTLGQIQNSVKVTNETLVPDEVCRTYDELIGNYSPDDYKTKAIKLSAETPFNCAGEEEAATWDRYSKIMSATSDIPEEASNKVTNLLTEFGEKMTYDFPAACNLLAEAEQIINQ